MRVSPLLVHRKEPLIIPRRLQCIAHPRYPVRVGRSAIDGLGVFATRRLKEGEFIGTITGRVYDARDIETKFTCFFSDEDDQEWALEPDWPFCYMNGRGDDGNVSFNTPNLYALRAIEADEELTLPYD